MPSIISPGSVCFAPTVIILASALLFWNEGRAVSRYRDLEAINRRVVELDPSTYQGNLDGKIVHATATATAGNNVEDDVFGVSVDALRLRRNVLTYQWVEDAYVSDVEQPDGSTKQNTTYSYYKMWKGGLTSSDYFHIPEGHQNPSSTKFTPSSWIASPVNFGAYNLTTAVSNRLTWFRSYTDLSITSIPDNGAASGAQLYSASFYYGSSPTVPIVGDTKVTFDYVPETQISLIAQQDKGSLGSFTTKSGSTDLMLSVGVVSADTMIAQAVANNEFMTSILRFVGFVVMWAGTSSLLRVHISFLDGFRCLVHLLASAMTIISFFVAALLSMVIIAVAWLWYRPLFLIPLVLGVGGLIFYVIKTRRQGHDGEGKEAIPSAFYDEEDDSLEDDSKVEMIPRIV